MKFLTPFHNSMEMTFSPPSLAGGKEYIQVPLNKTEHLNVKMLSINPAPLGRGSFALARLPAAIHRKVRRASAMARTQQGQNWTSAMLTSFPSSRCRIAATNIPLKLLHLRRGQNYSSHQRFQALLNFFFPRSSTTHEKGKLGCIAKMKADTLPATCSPFQY